MQIFFTLKFHLCRAYYVGTSSQEEGLPPEERCTFRGSFSKLNIQAGGILWQTYMIPDNHGQKGEYSGAAVWRSSPPIDASKNHIYTLPLETCILPLLTYLNVKKERIM